MNLLLLAHASPTVRPLYERALEGLPEPWEIVPFIAPPLAGVPGGGLSSRYVALADRLEVSAAAPTPLEALLLRLGLAPRARWGRVVLASWSAGYALALRLLDEQGLDGWIALDSGYADRDPDGTASDERLAPAVRLVADARAGRRLFWFGFTDIRTPYASTSEVAAELQRLGGPPEGLWHVERWPGGTARDHEDALRVDGPGFARRALEALLGAAPETLPTGRAPVEQEAPLSPLRAAVVARARGEIGVRESPVNVVPYAPRTVRKGRWITVQGLAWCARFASEIVWKAWGGDGAEHWALYWGPNDGNHTSRKPPPFSLRAAVSELIADARATGAWHDASTGYQPEPGDLVCYARIVNGVEKDPRIGQEGHVAIYVGKGLCISGNLGDAVREHPIEEPGRVVGWIRIEA